ncbi:ABC transporter substrate-binding protein [Paenibacillus xylanexedens]|uniref:ABC transporter substrate-binding protein n=1 Tax=Paenibacillus xylanexedens TaxID=528191 RepID=UPI003D07E717
MKKYGLILLSVVLLLGLLSACGGNGNNNNGTAKTNKENANNTPSAEVAAESKDPIELEMSVWGSDAQVALYDELVEEYKKLHPNVTVKTSVIPWADYQQKLAIMAATKTSPDIVWISERMIPQFMNGGQLLDISSVKEDAAYTFDDIIPSTLTAFEKDGKLYGIPFSTPPQVVFYNKNLFEANGLKSPMQLYEEGNWTYDEMVKASEAISKPQEGVYGVKFIQNSSNWSDNLIPLIWAMGGEIFNEDTTQFAMNTPETAKAINLFKGLLDKKAHPSIGEQLTFDTGKLGMAFENVTRTSAYRDKVDFEWDIAPLPEGDHGVKMPIGFGGYSIFKDAEYPEEALEYLKFISNKENAAKVAEFFVPQRESVLYSDEYLNKFPFPTVETMKVAAYDRLAEGTIRPSHPNWVKIDEQVTINLDAILLGSTTTEQALEIMEDSINPLLK